MSAAYAVLILAAYGSASVAVTYVWCRGAVKAIARQEAAEQQRADRIEEVNARLRGIPAAADNAEGMRLDWHDECELLWAAPYDPQTGLELLRRDIRKQRKEEDR